MVSESKRSVNIVRRVGYKFISTRFNDYLVYFPQATSKCYRFRGIIHNFSEALSQHKNLSSCKNRWALARTVGLTDDLPVWDDGNL